METRVCLFHELKGKFLLLSSKARDEECCFFLCIYQLCCCTLKTSFAFYVSPLSCHDLPNDISVPCQFEGYI